MEQERKALAILLDAALLLALVLVGYNAFLAPGFFGQPGIRYLETAKPAVTASYPDAEGKVNLNTATAEELETLPGIGPARAADIVAYRESIGGFASIEEIMEINGIGEAAFAAIRDRVYLD